MLLPATSMTGRTLYIINPAAGAGRSANAWASLERQWRARGVKLEAVRTTRPGEAMELASKAARDYGVLVAAGGDGTVSEVASGILGAAPPRAALGMLPLGTGNDIARSLGVRSAPEAVNALARGQTRGVDAIEVKCLVDGRPAVRYALGFVAVGITGELLRQTTPAVKRRFGQRLAYYYGLVLALWRYRSPELRVACDAMAREGRFLLVAASNTETFGGGMIIAPGASIADGQLNVNLIQAAGCWEVLRQLHLLRHGRHVTHPKVCYVPARTLAIQAATSLDVAADGDLVGHTPARIEIQPRALEVLIISNNSLSPG